jgi:hypothetical protein
VNISGQVPQEAQNGMVAIEEDWLGDRTPPEVIAVVKLRRANFKFDDDKQERRAVMKFVHIEPMLDAEDHKVAVQLLERACRARGGVVGAPDLELDIPEEREVDLDSPLSEPDPDDGQ